MMPIICFEGASAVGKTATAAGFREKYGAFVVPEVNLLFERPENESAEWYFERQVERWSIAVRESRSRLVILDGDPFQPLWYNWAYDYVRWQKLDFMEQFYRPKIAARTLRFPDLYFVFSTSEEELRRRKAADASRQRRGFEHHLKMIEPQRRYFQMMHSFAPDRVFFSESESIENNLEYVRERVSAFSKPKRDESEILFARIVDWLRGHKA